MIAAYFDLLEELKTEEGKQRARPCWSQNMTGIDIEACRCL